MPLDTEAERLEAIADRIFACGPPDMIGGYDMCVCGSGTTWPCPTTYAAWIARGLDPEAEMQKVLAALRRDLNARDPEHWPLEAHPKAFLRELDGQASCPACGTEGTVGTLGCPGGLLARHGDRYSSNCPPGHHCVQCGKPLVLSVAALGKETDGEILSANRDRR